MDEGDGDELHQTLTNRAVVQVGLGNFGKRHLEAWHRLGFADRLWIAEPDERKWPEAVPYQIPHERIVRTLSEALPYVEVVDIVTPTEQHLEVCLRALEAGKDVFIEKPMAMNAPDARRILELSERTARRVQVGYYYRFHPISQRLKVELRAGRLGAVRYLTGNFCGFKRARTDVGVTHTDGIHFVDLFIWLLEEMPVEVYAVCRDHFGRGLEDFSIVLMTFANDVVAKVESGYIQPGRWPDKVVANAMTTKDVVVVGDKASAEIDFEAETCVMSEVHHELQQGIWTPVMGSRSQLQLEVCDPIQLVCRELEAFLQSVATREPTLAGPRECGVDLAVLMESLYESARRREPIRIERTLSAKRRERPTFVRSAIT